jgi:hypothetical protein
MQHMHNHERSYEESIESFFDMSLISEPVVESNNQARVLDMIETFNKKDNFNICTFLGMRELRPLALVEGRVLSTQIYYPSLHEKRRQDRRKPRKTFFEFSYMNKRFTIPKDLVSKEENFLANMVVKYLFENIVVFIHRIHRTTHETDYKQFDFDECFRILNAIKENVPEIIITYPHTEGWRRGNSIQYKINIKTLHMRLANDYYPPTIMVVPLRGKGDLSRYLY